MMTFDQALKLLSRNARFMATVSAMNTLLIQNGIYTQQDFEVYFCQWSEKEAAKTDVMTEGEQWWRNGSPSESGWYIVTCVEAQDRKPFSRPAYWVTSKDSRWIGTEAGEIIMAATVLRWMPMPEPFNPEQNK